MAFFGLQKNQPQACDCPWLIGFTRSSYIFQTLSQQPKCYGIVTKSLKYSNFFIIGSFKGWLYVQYLYDAKIKILNLFSKIQFNLPPFSTMPDFMLPEEVHHALAFAILFCKYMRPIIIAVITSYGNLALCKIGGTWKGHQGNYEAYANLTFYNAKLYAIKKSFDKVYIFKIDDDLKLLLVGIIDSTLVIATLTLPPPFKAYLVESRGNLLLVMQYCERLDLFWSINEFEIPRVVFEIFKVEDEDDDCDPRLKFTLQFEFSTAINYWISFAQEKNNHWISSSTFQVSFF